MDAGDLPEMDKHLGLGYARSEVGSNWGLCFRLVEPRRVGLSLSRGARRALMSPSIERMQISGPTLSDQPGGWADQWASWGVGRNLRWGSTLGTFLSGNDVRQGDVAVIKVELALNQRPRRHRGYQLWWPR